MAEWTEQRWKGSRMNALGDSLTHGDITGTGVDGTPWTSYMGTYAGLAVCRNYGINGNKLAGPGGMADRCQEMDGDAQIVSVFGGMNDFCGGFALGAFGDTGIGSFYGALDVLAKNLYDRYPGALIFLITPPKCRSSIFGWETFTPNEAGRTLTDYRDAIVRVADRYSLPVLDLYSDGGMSCYLDTGDYRPDGLHFTDAGYERLARRIAVFINRF